MCCRIITTLATSSASSTSSLYDLSFLPLVRTNPEKGNDPTHGYVNYVDQGTAQGQGLIGQRDGKIYIGVDHTNIASGRGRNSIRLESKNRYTRGLVLLDLQHMPGGQCGSWPAL